MNAIDALAFVGFGMLALAVLGWLLERTGAASYLADVLLAPEVEVREPLSPDPEEDREINFGAELRCLGPLPKWGEENRGRAGGTADPVTSHGGNHATHK